MKVFAFLAAVGMASPVTAQGAATISPRPVSAVYVRSVSGDEARGQLLRLGPDTLTLLEQGASRDIPLAAISRIDARGDSVKNGAIIGAVVLGAWCAIVCGQGLDNANQVATVALINTGLGALIGAGIDAMHVGRTTIYQPGGTGSGGGPIGTRVRLLKSFRF